MSVSVQLPRDILVEVRVFRIPSASGKQVFAATSSEEITAGMVPLAPHRRALLGGDLLMTHVLLCDNDANIKVSDKVTIDGTEYRVSHIDIHNYGGHPHKQAVISLVE